MPALHPAHEQPRGRDGSVMRAASLIGAGLAGLLDGLLLPEVRFLAVAAWSATVLGIGLLWRAWQAWGEPRPTPRLLGGVLMGAGAYGAADAILVHVVGGFHHVPRGGDAWYFAVSAVAFVVGLRVSTIPLRARRRARARHV